MELRNLDGFQEIVIQMHDNPDADAVGSGYALYRYFQSKGKRVRLIYGGRFPISKSNMVLLLREYEIPVEYVTELDAPELLLTVDCQYGEGNVQKFPAKQVAMIDHHSTGRQSDEMSEIRSHIVSCSTICYDMLTKAGYDVNQDVKIATALYYGLYMDSNALAEISHPLDRDMIDCLQYDRGFVGRLCHANFSMAEMETAGIAMLRHSYDEKRRLSIVKSKACDPNVLGLIGDFVLQVDCVDICIVFNETPGGYKLSIRSCSQETAANDLAKFLTEGIGNGGGHLDKAGGYISSGQFTEKYGDRTIEGYFYSRIEEYFAMYDVVHARNGIVWDESFRLYRKKPYIYGYVKTTDLFAAGTSCRVRTLEGDVFVTAGEETYLMIGVLGEVYPIRREAFEKKYLPKEASYERAFEYTPKVWNLSDGTATEIMGAAKQCEALPDAYIYARQLTKAMKLFTNWNYESYMEGKQGDYLACSGENKSDCYLIKKEVMLETYEEVQA